VVLRPPLALRGFNIAAVWHERTHHDPAHRWLRSAIAQVAMGARSKKGRKGNSWALVVPRRGAAGSRAASLPRGREIPGGSTDSI
jgi:hypothetical protein